MCGVTETMKRIEVLLADDNGMVRKEFMKSLEREEDLEVVGEAKNGARSLQQQFAIIEI